MKELMTNPIAEGFRMPGEFEEHEATLILWPERADNWRNGGKPAQEIFAKLANQISLYEKVYVGVNDRQYANARSLLDDSVTLLEISNDDSWVRDCGPTFVKNDEGVIRGVNWGFNAWGGLVDGLYFPWDKDQMVCPKFCEALGKDYYNLEEFILEGGSIHVDGEGTLITTKACLLSEGRNPDLTQEQIEEILKRTLNLEKIIWLENGIYLDETNEHVDNIIHYVAPGEIVLSWTDDEDDPQYELSKAAYDVLANETDAKGRKLKIHKMMLPTPILITEEESRGVDSIKGTLPRLEGDRLAASYANFYIANGSVFVPQFDDPNDVLAIELISEIFPDRVVVPIYAREILLGGGNIHCITQQVPK
ncbi:agmatine deiminase [Mollicutes bacterium LVI A0039]|nr:agmatine deiminase [Mollicutes bacterium LVI A0039]